MDQVIIVIYPYITNRFNLEISGLTSCFLQSLTKNAFKIELGTSL